ncbi:MAG: hypothetical protein MUE74_01020 [Bacteroidales bacterium]|jgi:hypothetical protein|nr:hypothetical protein [Bacteroidales bacterium]
MKDLKEISGKDAFKVPDDYFGKLNDRIISAAMKEERPPANKGKYRKIRPLLAIAASVAILAMIGFGALKIFIPDKKLPGFPEISLQEFTENYLDDIDILTLEEGVAPVASFEKVPDLTSDEIIDYLILENIDLSDIYEIL